MDDKTQKKNTWIAQALTVMEERIAHISQSIQRATEAAQGEEKSSAGDKYETARAMSHLEREMHSKQLLKAQQELETLHRIDTGSKSGMVPGAAALCDNTWYFLSIGLGQITCGEESVVFFSPASPLGALFLNKTIGDSVLFNGKQLLIEDVI